MNDKINFTRTVDAYRARQGKFRIVEVPPMQYLMVDGHGDPNISPTYVRALQTLYPVAYQLKFFSKRQLGRDYVVPPLEGLWWADDMAVFTSARDKNRWQWTMMIMAPEWISRENFDHVITQVSAKVSPADLAQVRLADLNEGLSVQTLHVGPFDAEAEVLERMHDSFIPQNGLSLTGRHHEIYFSDPRRSAPEKLRTLLRQPVTSAS